MHDTAPDRPIVATETGSVRGTSAALQGVVVFAGIPYAGTTAGDRRWRPPSRAARWDGVRDASGFGPVCPQHQRRSAYPISEDCLSVNVWTSDPSPEAARPVLVWIYGGRFIEGASGDPQFDGSGLAAKGLVVVTLNYRTDVFGFLATDELSRESGCGASGNYGLLDQIAALQWVQRNIAGFGGDPTRVTIAGQSAGAASVMDLVYSPLTDGLLHGAIAESGALHPKDPALAYLAAAYRTLPDAEREGARYLADRGVSTVAELRALSVEALLIGNDADEPGTAAHRPPLFRPVLDGHVFARTYSDTLTAGMHQDVPVLTGTTLDEDGASPLPKGTLEEYLDRLRRDHGDLADEFLALYPASDDAGAHAASNLLARERSRTSTYLWSRLRGRTATSPAFTYCWTHAAPGEDSAARGAFHGSEIWYFLDSLHATDRSWTDEDRRIAATVSDYVAHFVTKGNPNGTGLPIWKAVDPAHPSTMEIGDAFRSIEVAAPARFDLHRRFLESCSRAR